MELSFKTVYSWKNRNYQVWKHDVDIMSLHALLVDYITANSKELHSYIYHDYSVCWDMLLTRFQRYCE